MEAPVYKQISEIIKSFHGLSIECLQVVKQQYPELSLDTLSSIVAQEYQKRMKMNHNKSQFTINRYWKAYSSGINNKEPPGKILRMSRHFDVCPCLVAKLILQKYFESFEGPDQSPTNMNIYLRDTSLIPDKDLAYEVFLCTLYDNLYSPISETVKHSLGQQYEIKLHNEVKRLGLAFQDEEYLRKYGYDKTPDVKLEVPVAVDGCVINWIESKALFGDEDLHQEYMKNQYLSYWNRFGPGLVIYWYGCVKTIIDITDKRFIVRDHFPSNVIELTLGA